LVHHVTGMVQKVKSRRGGLRGIAFVHLVVCSRICVGDGVSPKGVVSKTQTFEEEVEEEEEEEIEANEAAIKLVIIFCCCVDVTGS
jgi:hypothetical protein